MKLTLRELDQKTRKEDEDVGEEHWR